MANNFKETNETQINKNISEIVSKKIEETFATGRDIYFLSRLGADLGKKILRDIEESTGLNLSEFLRQHTEYNPIESENDEKVLFIRRPGSDIDQPIKTGDKTRYIRSFWTAFFKPSADGEKRFVNIENGTFSLEVEESDEYIEIDSELMPPAHEPDFSETSSRISKWLIRHGLHKSRFERKNNAASHSPESLLDKIIDALSPEQRKRLTLPLDIISILKER